MRRNVSPAVAIIVVLLVLVAAAAFVWLRVTGERRPGPSTSALTTRSTAGARRGERRRDTETGTQRRGRGSRRGTSQQQPPG